MNTMIIYFYLLILMFLSIDSSSIRGRNMKNDLVPLPSSRLDSLKKDSNSLKIISSEPFYVQLQIPKSVENEIKEAKQKNTKRKHSAKKRISKIKPLRKKHRNRRDLLRSKIRSRQEKSNHMENLHAANKTGHQLKNDTKNEISREEILKVLSLHSKKKDLKRNKAEGIKNIKDDEMNDLRHKVNTPNGNHHKTQFSHTHQKPYFSMAYPNTPKYDIQPRKYTYQDLMADRERLEQKIKYIKNMLKVNDSTTDDTVRVRRRSESDKTANKIAKMFLTLSAVNGLHDKRKSKCTKDDIDENERIQDVWEKERKNSLSRKSSSSNEERYKVKKWIEFMKNKRSSTKTCPCMTNVHGEDGDIFPLEQKLPKGYFLMERGRSSEESSESFRDSFYSSREKFSKQNGKSQFQKSQEDQENKLKALGKNGKKKIELPFDDLELYRSRAKQILRNAEEILDRIKEEEEKRLAGPNILLSQLKELTSKIQGDPRNNENDLIRKIQKNLGWGPLAKPQENSDKNSFIDNVKSYILDPYEKAKALTDESTKKLSSYLLRNLGKLQESSDEEETPENTLQVFFGQVPQAEEKPSSASLAKELKPDSLSKDKEDLKYQEDTISTVVKGDDHQEEQYKQRMEEIIKEQQKKIDEHTVLEDPENNNKELDSFDFKSLKDKIKTEKQGKEIVKESQSEKPLGEDEREKLENVGSKKDKIESSEDRLSDEKPTNTYLTSEKLFLGKKETFPSEKKATDFPASRNLQEEEEFEKETEKTIKTVHEKDSVGDQEAKINFEEKQENDDVVNNQEKVNEKELKEISDVLEKLSSIPTNLKEDNLKTNTKNDDVVASPHFLSDEDDFEAAPRFLTDLNDYLMYDDDKDFEIPAKTFQAAEKSIETKLNEEAVKEKLEKEREDPTELNIDKNMSTPLQETVNLKESSKENTKLPSQTEILKKNETQETFKDETTQMEFDNKKILGDTDQKQEIKQPEYKIQTNEETLKSEHLDDDEDNQTSENVTEKEYFEKETSKTENTVDLKTSKEIVENYSKTVENNQKDINEDSSLTANLEKDKNSNENINQETSNTKSDDSSLLKAVKSEKTFERDISDESALKNSSRETWNVEKEEKTLRAENPIKEVTEESFGKNTNSNEEKLMKEANDDETENSKNHGTLLKATLNTQRDENEVNEEENSAKTDDEVKEKFRNRDENSNDDTPSEIGLNEHDETLKATNFKENDEKTENTEKIRSKELLNKNQGDEYSNEKTFLTSEKVPDYGSQEKKIKDSDELIETFGETLDKQDDKISEKSHETIIKTVYAQDQETRNAKATLKAEHPDENIQIENETSQKTPLKTILSSQEQGTINEQISLTKEKTDDIQNEKSSGETLKEALDNQNEENMEESETFFRMGKSDEVQDESSDEKSSHETVKAVSNTQNEENKEAEENETSLRMEKSDETQHETSEEKSRDETSKTRIDDRKEKKQEVNENETILKKKNLDEIHDEKSSTETLKKALGNRNEDSEIPNKNAKTSETKEENSDETLKAALEDRKEENLERVDEEETVLRNEKSDENENEKSDETLKETLSSHNEDETFFKNGKASEIQHENSKENSDETLKAALEDQENLERVDEEETVLRNEKSDENESEKSDETLKKALDDEKDEEDETLFKNEKPIEVKYEHLGEKSSDEALEAALDDHKEKNLKEKNGDETTLKKKNLDESENEKSDEALKDNRNGKASEVKEGSKEESSDEALKAALDDHKENLEVDEGETNQRAENEQNQHEQNSNENYSEDTLKSVLDNETQESPKKEYDDDTLEEAEFSQKRQKNSDEDKTDLQVAFENQQPGNTQKINSNETPSIEDNSNEEGGQTEVLDDQKRSKTESLRKLDDDEKLLRAENLKEDFKNPENTNSQEDNDENLKPTQKNSKEVDDGTLRVEDRNEVEENNENDSPMRSANVEDQLDNAINDKTLLKSEKASEEELGSSKNRGESEETYRQQDFDNRIDHKNQETLKSVHFDDMTGRSEESLYETLKVINPLVENDHSEADSQDPRGEFFSSDQFKKPGFPTGHFKTNNLKVPKSIGKIMRDLGGKEKDDVTSLQNLNPDKIDHIIDKIHEAEQQTLQNGQAVDCRKECACADEIDTKSRKIGRYEIAKDFLNWMKDLQLNRVLSDD